MSDVTTPPITTERLNELAFSFKKSQALAAALEINLFTALSKGAATAGELAARCDASPEAIDRLLVVCGAMELVIKDGARFTNAPDVERFLVRDKRGFFGDYLRFTIGAEYAEWGGFPICPNSRVLKMVCFPIFGFPKPFIPTRGPKFI